MAASSVTSSKSGKNWSVGDILGRSKEGFKPLNTEDADGLLDEDSDSEVSILIKAKPAKKNNFLNKYDKLITEIIQEL